MTQGKLIVIEGLDHSDKTNQLKLLAQRLKTSGHFVEYTEVSTTNESSDYYINKYNSGGYGEKDTISPNKESSLLFFMTKFTTLDCHS